MRRLAPALDGALTRRAIVHSPHTWNATAATFLIFACFDLAVAFLVPEFDRARVLPLAAFIAAIAVTIFLSRPPERGSLGSHLVVAAVYVGVSAAIFAHAPQGAGPAITGMFIPVLAALWIPERRHAAGHLIAASILMLLAATSGGNDAGTLVTVLCFIPAAVGLYVVCMAVLDAVEAQGEALDRLALRDPLTGVGNRRHLEQELAAELTRHRSAGRTLAIVECSVRDLAACNVRVGRAAGDAILTALARALADCAPSDATVARLDGERFVVLLPNSTTAHSERFLDQVIAALPTRAGTDPLVVLAGTAAFPDDGDEAAQLLAAAGQRRTARSRDTTLAGSQAATWTLLISGAEPASSPDLPRRVSRRHLAGDRAIWMTIGAALIGYAAIVAVVQAASGALGGPSLNVVIAATGLCGLWTLLTRPPAIGSWRNHVVIAAAYLLPFSAVLAAAPSASWAVDTALLAPLLIATRLTDRRQILAHFAAITLLALGLAASGLVDRPALVALAALTSNTWVLGVCTLVVFEAAEQQWQEIRQLVRLDPLTGVGNAGLLDERLASEIPRHATLQLPLAVLEVDISDFEGLSQRHGRGAANHALRDVAAALQATVGANATIARVRESTFRILMPIADVDELRPERADELTDRIRAAVVSTSRRDRTVLPRLGVAVYPTDALTADGLIATASQRRKEASVGEVLTEPAGEQRATSRGHAA